jgi:hypothetical protein
MKYITKLKLAAVHQLCELSDKSTENMIQLMQDSCKVGLDTCINYLTLGSEKHQELFEEVNSFTEVIENVMEGIID